MKKVVHEGVIMHYEACNHSRFYFGLGFNIGIKELRGSDYIPG